MSLVGAHECLSVSATSEIARPLCRHSGLPVCDGSSPCGATISVDGGEPLSPTPCPGGEETSAIPAVTLSAAPTTGTGDGDDWTLVQGRRAARRQTVPPPHSPVPGEPPGTVSKTLIQPSPNETAVMAALRRNEEEKRARDARRARMVERAREARHSPGADSDSGTAAGSAESAPLGSAAPSTADPSGRPLSSLSSGSVSSMCPPPPPPRRPSVPPPQPPDRSLGAGHSLATPQSAPRSLDPPPAPSRPGKRTYACDGSPSERGTPRSRPRPSAKAGGGRASSADGRLLPRMALTLGFTSRVAPRRGPSRVTVLHCI